MAQAKPSQTKPLTVRTAGQTVAAVVRTARPELSWTDAKKLVAKRQVSVNGNLCTDDARRLNVGDLLVIGATARSKGLDEREIRIRHLDDDLIVVEKPAGVTSTRHAEERDWSDRRRQVQPTLDELLKPLVASQVGKMRLDTSPTMLSDAIKAASRNKAIRLPGVIAVHRLDRETSGLMVFARNRACELKLISMFAQHRVDRRYRAVVLGDCPDMIIDTHLAKVGEQRRSVPKSTSGAQHAVTHVTRVAKHGGYTMIECKLETGRTHQIRIHLAERGHSVCGDKIYRCDIPDKSDPPRHALHAYSIAFEHPVTAKAIQFEMEFPRDLAAWMKPFGF